MLYDDGADTSILQPLPLCKMFGSATGSNYMGADGVRNPVGFRNWIRQCNSACSAIDLRASHSERRVVTNWTSVQLFDHWSNDESAAGATSRFFHWTAWHTLPRPCPPTGGTYWLCRVARLFSGRVAIKARKVAQKSPNSSADRLRIYPKFTNSKTKAK